MESNVINLIDIKFDYKNHKKKISNKSNKFIKESFSLGLTALNKFNTHKFINGPISKKTFLNKKYPGITEYISNKVNINNFAMLIYNQELSSPLTTHIPIKNVSKN